MVPWFHRACAVHPWVTKHVNAKAVVVDWGQGDGADGLDLTSTNCKLRVMRLTEDDTNDDTWDTFFGSNAAKPINLADRDGNGVPAVSTSSTCPSHASTGEKRSRTSTFDVCNDIEKLFKTDNGNKVRYVAKCYIYKSTLTARSTGGSTSHFICHRSACKLKAGLQDSLPASI